jgi:hypothetical protein
MKKNILLLYILFYALTGLIAAYKLNKLDMVFGIISRDFGFFSHRYDFNKDVFVSHVKSSV